MPRFDPQRVAGLRHDRLAVDEVAVDFLLRVALAEPRFHRLVHAAVGRERLVEECGVPLARRGAVELGRQRRAPCAAGLVVVAHVASRLLEVGGQAPPLERLREQLRRLLAREMHAAELSDRVVAVLHEHRVVQTGRALAARRRRGTSVCPGDLVDVAGELVEEEPP
jgi:hypothetical protein